MDENKMDVVAHVRGLVGMLLGAVVGYFVFRWMVGQGLYALAIPGAMSGLACGYASRIHSRWLAAACGVCGAVLGIVLEWSTFPFIDDGSLGYFVTHLYQLRGLTLVMLVLGIVFAAWFGLGRPGGKA